MQIAPVVHRFLGCLAIAWLVGAIPAGAQIVFQVDSTLDEIDDDLLDGICHTDSGTCSLRAAIMQANLATGAGATILLPAGTYGLTRPIVGSDGPDSGDLNLTTPTAGNPPISIVGAGPAVTVIDANQQYRVIDVAAGRTALLSGVRISGGLTPGSGGGIISFGSLILHACSIDENVAGTFGGGIAAYGPLSLIESTVSANTSINFAGGGIFASSVEMTGSTISGNQALAGHGGGLVVSGGPLRASSSTISGNSAAQDAGGIMFASSVGSADLYNVSIVFNRGDSDGNLTGVSGGVWVGFTSVFSVRNSLIAGNTLVGSALDNDCFGTIGSYGRNLFGTDDACTILAVTGSWTLLDSLDGIGPLAMNGGGTATHALLPGSNAIDGGDPELGCIDGEGPIATDQRGAPRTFGDACDLGAYESGTLFLDDFESGDLSAWVS